MYELNNLRVLNDYLNQTIDALLRAQRLGAVAGLSHTPFAQNSIFGTTPFAGSPLGVDPTVAGLSHTPFGQGVFPTPFGTPVGQFGSAINATPFGSVYPVVDPFVAQRGLSHSPVAGWQQPWQQWSTIAEMARQQQLTQAIAARQSILEAMVRSAGIPV